MNISFQIKNICLKNKLYLVEDAAQSFNSFFKKKAVGTFGDFGCYSFHETKNLHAGMSGALVLKNKKNLTYKMILTTFMNKNDTTTKNINRNNNNSSNKNENNNNNNNKNNNYITDKNINKQTKHRLIVNKFMLYLISKKLEIHFSKLNFFKLFLFKN